MCGFLNGVWLILRYLNCVCECVGGGGADLCLNVIWGCYFFGGCLSSLASHMSCILHEAQLVDDSIFL